jgi:hypothetical protein
LVSIFVVRRAAFCWLCDGGDVDLGWLELYHQQSAVVVRDAGAKNKAKLPVRVFHQLHAC